MPRCPNCGRNTARTEDWVCQWCGYPLLSGAYKKIPKTYKQLKEEGLDQPPPSEAESELEADIEAEPEPAEPPPPPRRKPVARPAPERTPVMKIEPVTGPPPKPKPKPVARPMPERTPVMKIEPVSEPPLESSVEPETESVDESRPEPASRAEPVMVSPEEESPPPVTEARPELPPEPLPELASNEVELTIERLISAFKADRASTDTKLTGKILKLTGVVTKVIVKDYLDIFYVLITSNGVEGLWNVRCTFGKPHAAELHRLTLGETVTIQGAYGGFERNIILRDCALVR